MIYWQLLGVYLKIGIFGFGGGYAMLSLIQYEVVDKYHWLTLQEFTDVVAISQMTPGPIGINSATYIGYTATGSVWGRLIRHLCRLSALFFTGIVDFIFLCQIQKQQICRRRLYRFTPHDCRADRSCCPLIDE